MIMSSRRRTWRLLKYGLGVALALCIFLLFFFPSWGEVETVEKLRAVQRRHQSKQEQLHQDLDDDVGSKHKQFRPNDIFEYNKDGYKNSKSLQERLKPKLVSVGNDPPWDDLGAARTIEDVAIREEGYKKFAFNSLVSLRIGE